MSERKIANNHYPGLDVVRVIAIAGIVLMHVLANGNYDLSGFLFEKVIGKELWIDRREKSKSLAWSSVLLALKNIKGEVVDRPKALGDIRGVTYIYGIFYRFGLIDVPDEAKEKMKKAFSKSS